MYNTIFQTGKMIVTTNDSTIKAVIDPFFRLLDNDKYGFELHLLDINTTDTGKIRSMLTYVGQEVFRIGFQDVLSVLGIPVNKQPYIMEDRLTIGIVYYRDDLAKLLSEVIVRRDPNYIISSKWLQNTP